MIGIFDSGSGGLSVLRVLRERAPNADIVYFGDLKNSPYGNKSREELGALTVLGIQRLIDEGATEIVSACNSVSVSIALPMFDVLKFPRTSLIEMVGPTVAQFKGVKANVLVAATQATVDSRVYYDGLRMAGADTTSVAMPELVDLIEGDAGESAIRHTIREAFTPYTEGGYTHLILGCTHYPLVHSQFREVVDELGMQVEIVDPAEAVADAVVKQFSIDHVGKQRFLLSQDSATFRRFAEKHCFVKESELIVI